MSIKADAEKAATKLLADTGWASRIPVDPAKIARALGLSVVTANLPQSVSGALVKEPGRDPSILLSLADSPNRQRFTCAHELGHYMKRSERLDPAYEYVDYRNPKSSAGIDFEEMYANAFAAALLMPAAQVRSMKRGSSDIELALKFGVSREAMRLRLDALK